MGVNEDSLNGVYDVYFNVKFQSNEIRYIFTHQLFNNNISVHFNFLALTRVLVFAINIPHSYMTHTNSLAFTQSACSVCYPTNTVLFYVKYPQCECICDC